MAVDDLVIETCFHKWVGLRKVVRGELVWDVAAEDSVNYHNRDTCFVPVVEISVTKRWPLLVPKKLKRCVANCT